MGNFILTKKKKCQKPLQNPLPEVHQEPQPKRPLVNQPVDQLQRPKPQLSQRLPEHQRKQLNQKPPPQKEEERQLPQRREPLRVEHQLKKEVENQKPLRNNCLLSPFAYYS